VPGAPTNRAVRDWVRALEWVQENIAAFGGDPAKVTIAGQSAGGGACGTLLGVPAARGLFRGAICMSGSTTLTQTPAGVRAVAAQMAEQLGVATLDRDALDGLSAGTILAAQEAVTTVGMGALSGQRDATAVAAVLSGGIAMPWAPWTDGEVVTDDPLRAAASSEVAILTGATAHEFNIAWLTADWITADQVRDGLAKAGTSPRRWPRRAARHTATTSAGRLQAARWPGLPSTAWTSRSSSTSSMRRAWRKQPAGRRPDRWPPRYTVPGRGSSPRPTRAGHATTPAVARSWSSPQSPRSRTTRCGWNGRPGPRPDATEGQRPRPRSRPVP
jgi:hypothetical protein